MEENIISKLFKTKISSRKLSTNELRVIYYSAIYIEKIKLDCVIMIDMDTNRYIIAGINLVNFEIISLHTHHAIKMLEMLDKTDIDSNSYNFNNKLDTYIEYFKKLSSTDKSLHKFKDFIFLIQDKNSYRKEEISLTNNSQIIRVCELIVIVNSAGLISGYSDIPIQDRKSAQKLRLYQDILFSISFSNEILELNVIATRTMSSLSSMQYRIYFNNIMGFNYYEKGIHISENLTLKSLSNSILRSDFMPKDSLKFEGKSISKSPYLIIIPLDNALLKINELTICVWQNKSAELCKVNVQSPALI